MGSRLFGFMSTSVLMGSLVLGGSFYLPQKAYADGHQVQLSLAEAIDIALKNNEDIKESFNQISAAEAEVMIAKGTYDLTLYNEFRYGAYNSLSSSDFPANEQGNHTEKYMRNDVGLSQRIPTGSTLRVYYTYMDETALNVSPANPGSGDRDSVTVELAQSLLKGLGDMANRAAIKDAMLSVRDSKVGRSLTISQVTLSVIQSYWSLAIALNNHKVSERTLNLAYEVYQRELVRYKRGISRGVDVERARLAVDQRKFVLNQYERDIKVAEEQLMFLLNSPDLKDGVDIVPASPLIKEVQAVPEKDLSTNMAYQNRYELQQLAIMLEKLDIEYGVKRNNLLPQLDLVLGYSSAEGNDYLRGGELFKGSDSQDSWYVGASFNYPIQNRSSRGSVKQTEKLIDIAKDRVSKTRRSIGTEVDNVLHNLVMAQEGIPTAKKALDTAERVVKGEETRFEFGGINNRDLLASQDELGREEMSYFIALAQYNMALAEYNYAIGNLLEKYQINVSDTEANML